MRRRSALSWVWMAGALVGGAIAFPSASRAGFEIVADSVAVDKGNHTILFSLVFSQPPDFFTVGDNGSPHNAFQYEIDGDWMHGQDTFGFDRIDAVVRGIEIHSSGALPIRGIRGPSGPDAGGWGRVLTSVPIVIEGPTVTFAIDQRIIDDRDGKFQYRAFALENGEMTSLIQRTVVPLPTAVWSGLALCGGLCLARAIKRIRNKGATATTRFIE